MIGNNPSFVEAFNWETNEAGYLTWVEGESEFGGDYLKFTPTYKAELTNTGNMILGAYEGSGFRGSEGEAAKEIAEELGYELTTDSLTVSESTYNNSAGTRGESVLFLKRDGSKIDFLPLNHCGWIVIGGGVEIKLLNYWYE